ncbi:class I SAM-dependent DNA methyltransferase [Flavobacterium pedocola]
MNASFDIAAQHYDTAFTHTVIGKLQRDLVYGHLSEILKNKPEAILEINCGTGEDAIWLAKQHFKVIATDISPEMIAVAKNKADLKNLNFQQADINQLSEIFPHVKFDLIFSNFGGLNCLSKTELKAFFISATELLTENGRVVLVVMPKNTLWEQLYFLLKGNLKNALRRKKEVVLANVAGENVKTYYHNPKELVKVSNDSFRLNQAKPIGFFVPPSYLEPFFRSKPTLISILNRLEKSIKNQSFLARYADHYLIELQKK